MDNQNIVSFQIEVSYQKVIGILRRDNKDNIAECFNQLRTGNDIQLNRNTTIRFKKPKYIIYSNNLNDLKYYSDNTKGITK